MFFGSKRETQTGSETKKTLIAARGLIENEADWFGARHNPIPSNKCALQAVSAVALGTEAASLARAALDAVAGGDMFKFNDDHTHAEVLAAFDRAIAAA